MNFLFYYNFKVQPSNLYLIINPAPKSRTINLQMCSTVAQDNVNSFDAKSRDCPIKTIKNLPGLALGKKINQFLKVAANASISSVLE
jgi:hypothetical protein